MLHRDIFSKSALRSHLLRQSFHTLLKYHSSSQSAAADGKGAPDTKAREEKVSDEDDEGDRMVDEGDGYAERFVEVAFDVVPDPFRVISIFPVVLATKISYWHTRCICVVKEVVLPKYYTSRS